MTIKNLKKEAIALLKQKHGDDTVKNDHALDAELLLAFALSKTRLQLTLVADQEASPEEENAFRALIARRANHEPVAYLIGQKDFFGLTLKTRPGALIPRPETELLVNLALEHFHFCQRHHAIIDVGTGSGAIAIALASNIGEKIFATEFSSQALALAKENIADHNFTKRIELLPGNGIEPVLGKGGLKNSEELLVIANPPYLPTKVWQESMKDVRDFEPREALDGGTDGLDLYRVLLNQLEEVKLPIIGIFEIDPTQAKTLPAEIAKHFPEAELIVHKDLAGLSRAVMFKFTP